MNSFSCVLIFECENLSSIREKIIVSMNSLVSNELASAPFYVRGQILNNLDEDRNHEFKVSKARSRYHGLKDMYW